MVYHIENGRFDELRLKKRRGHRKQRFAWKYHFALPHCVNGTRELEISEPFDKIFSEKTETAEISEVVFFEMKIIYIIDYLFETRAYGEVEAVFLAVENVEIGESVVFSRFHIRVHHRQFVKVGQKSEISHFLS
jgi:hypothetical protein